MTKAIIRFFLVLTIALTFATFNRRVTISRPPVGLNVTEVTPSLLISDQLSISEIEALKGKVDLIVRLNGDGDDSKGVTIEAERLTASSVGIDFVFINAHEGYIAGEGYRQSVEKVAGAIRSAGQGARVLIHCKNGAHRAPTMAAAYLREIGYSYDEAIKLTGLDSISALPGKYAKYIETIFYDPEK